MSILHFDLNRTWFKCDITHLLVRATRVYHQGKHLADTS